MQQYKKNLGKVMITPEGAWRNNIDYEILSVVNDNSTDRCYISKCYVPIGVTLDNSEYWMPLNVAGYSDTNFMIISKKRADGQLESFTIETAIASIAEVNRKVGCIICFFNNNTDRLDIGGSWEIWQFNDTNLYNWNDVNSWINIYYNYNKFVGWFANEAKLKTRYKYPHVGMYAYVGTQLNEAVVYRCDVETIWSKTSETAKDYVKVIVKGNVSIGENGNWFVDGIDTCIPASIKGDNGRTPYFRNNANKLEYSYDEIVWYEISDYLAHYYRYHNNKLQHSNDNIIWEDVSDYISAWFRWSSDNKIQISRDGYTWSDLSNVFSNNLHISRYIGIDESLPTSGIAEGTIYAKGPTYADGDTSHANPIYRLWVYAWKGDTLAWQDNGEFTSIAAGVVQEIGDSETEVMSQKAVSTKLSELGSAARCLNPKESNNVDLYISDEVGNSIAEFGGGHVRTQKFNSETDGQISVLNTEDADIKIADENGNVILYSKDGEVRTKNFDTKKTPKIVDDAEDDLDIADENGNIVLRIKDGHLQTQRFDSSAQGNNTLKGKKFSIIGDSISTYKGYVETTDGDGYRAFGSYHQGNANMPSVNDTWWMKFAKQTGMELLKNCSWSSSLVCGNSSSTTTADAGCSTKRVNDLARDSITPDLVLIYMGINDMAYNKEVGTWDGNKNIPQDSTSINIFSDAYALMVDKVMRTYPKAQVCCFTLLESLQFGNNSKFPTINDSKVALKAYNDVIKEVASSLGCNLIDLHACGINTHNIDDYTIDRLHPTYKGTTLMANKVSQEIISKVQF